VNPGGAIASPGLCPLARHTLAGADAQHDVSIAAPAMLYSAHSGEPAPAGSPRAASGNMLSRAQRNSALFCLYSRYNEEATVMGGIEP
jgi:hypothetical protein